MVSEVCPSTIFRLLKAWPTYPFSNFMSDVRLYFAYCLDVFREQYDSHSDEFARRIYQLFADPTVSITKIERDFLISCVLRRIVKICCLVFSAVSLGLYHLECLFVFQLSLSYPQYPSDFHV